MLLIKQIATECRSAMEIVFPDSDMSYKCGVGSILLYNELKNNNIKATLVSKYRFENTNGIDDYDSHCWVEIGNTVIDITATQYEYGKGQPVLITNTTDYNYSTRFGNDYGVMRDNDVLGLVDTWDTNDRYEINHSKLKVVLKSIRSK